MDSKLRKAAEAYRHAASLLTLRAELLEGAERVPDAATLTRHVREAASMSRFMEVLDVEGFVMDGPDSTLARMTEHVEVEAR